MPKLYPVSVRIDPKTITEIKDDKPDLLHLLMDEANLRRLSSVVCGIIIELDRAKQRESKNDFSNRRKSTVIFVEGNIGAGKSTFLRQMKKISNLVEIVPEPVPDKYLDYLCNDPVKWAFPFQLIMATLRKEAQDKALKESKKGKLVFLERSLHADSIFAEIAIKEEQEKQWYRNFRNNVLGDIIATPDLIVYLDSSTDGCMQRIEKRASEDPARKGELKYDVDYIEKLNSGHDKWIFNEATKIAPVLTINVDNVDFRKKSTALAIMQRITEMIVSPDIFRNEIIEGVDFFDREDVLDFVENIMDDMENERQNTITLEDAKKKTGNDGAKMKPFFVGNSPVEMQNLSEVLEDLKNFHPFSLI